MLTGCTAFPSCHTRQFLGASALGAEKIVDFGQPDARRGQETHGVPQDPGTGQRGDGDAVRAGLQSSGRHVQDESRRAGLWTDRRTRRRRRRRAASGTRATSLSISTRIRGGVRECVSAKCSSRRQRPCGAPAKAKKISKVCGLPGAQPPSIDSRLHVGPVFLGVRMADDEEARLAIGLVVFRPQGELGRVVVGLCRSPKGPVPRQWRLWRPRGRIMRVPRFSCLASLRWDGRRNQSTNRKLDHSVRRHSPQVFSPLPGEIDMRTPPSFNIGSACALPSLPAFFLTTP